MPRLYISQLVFFFLISLLLLLFFFSIALSLFFVPISFKNFSSSPMACLSIKTSTSHLFSYYFYHLCPTFPKFCLNVWYLICPFYHLVYKYITDYLVALYYKYLVLFFLLIFLKNIPMALYPIVNW